MTRPPTGRLFGTPTGCDLVITRTFRAPAEDVWASVTESERTARWFGAWEGHGAPGHTIKMQMAFEEGAPWFDVHIDACEPPRRLAVSMGEWHLELQLSETKGSTELRLVHHLDSPDHVSDFGPGWEYYLDLLVAARDGSPQPEFADYDPSMRPYFKALSLES